MAEKADMRRYDLTANTEDSKEKRRWESKKKEKMALRKRKDGIQQIIQRLLKKRDKRNLNNGCIIIVVNY